MLFIGLGPVRMVKTYDRGLESSARDAAGFGHHFQAQVTVFHYFTFLR